MGEVFQVAMLLPTEKSGDRIIIAEQDAPEQSYALDRGLRARLKVRIKPHGVRWLIVKSEWGWAIPSLLPLLR